MGLAQENAFPAVRNEVILVGRNQLGIRAHIDKMLQVHIEPNAIILSRFCAFFSGIPCPLHFPFHIIKRPVSAVSPLKRICLHLPLEIAPDVVGIIYIPAQNSIFDKRAIIGNNGELSIDQHLREQFFQPRALAANPEILRPDTRDIGKQDSQADQPQEQPAEGKWPLPQQPQYEKRDHYGQYQQIEARTGDAILADAADRPNPQQRQRSQGDVRERPVEPFEMPLTFRDLHPQQVAQERLHQKAQYHIGHTPVGQFPSKEDPDDIQEQHHGIRHQRRRQDIIHDHPQHRFSLSGRFFRYERAAQQRRYHEGQEHKGVFRPLVGQVEGEQKVHGGDQG